LNKILFWFKFIENFTLDINDLFKSFDLNITFFTHEMRTASLGAEYTKWEILPFQFHEDGETWSFDKLVVTSNTGLVNWYCSKLNYTNEEYEKICNDENVKILGSFFHRYKIVSEKINEIMNLFSGYKFNNFDFNCIDKLLSQTNFKLKQPKLYTLCVEINNYKKKKDLLFKNSIEIEKSIEFSQIALFNYITAFHQKNKKK
jgi:hypothetical protein